MMVGQFHLTPSSVADSEKAVVENLCKTWWLQVGGWWHRQEAPRFTWNIPRILTRHAWVWSIVES
jgi:hypothetical protein